MPRLLSITERNDTAFSQIGEAIILGGASLLGLARAGASAAGLGTWFQGTYGQLLLNADGTFTYRLDNNDPDTNALGAGQTADDRFTYTYVENGTTRTDTITIRVAGIDEPGQQVTNATETIDYTASATIAADQQIVNLSNSVFVIRSHSAANSEILLVNDGMIRAGSATAWDIIGVIVSQQIPGVGISSFTNNGLIETTAGVGGAIGVHAMAKGTILNNGVIRAFSDRSIGIESYYHGEHIVNRGAIDVMSARGEAMGIWSRGLFAHIENSGLIYAQSDRAGDWRSLSGIRTGQSHGLLIENSGTIHVVSNDPVRAGIGVLIFQDSPNPHAYGTVVNRGTIVADIALKGYSGFQTSINVTNSGRIEGDIQFEAGQNIVTNAAGGTIVGDFQMGLFNEIVVNRGTIVGEILLGGGGDLFDNRGGALAGAADGGDGFDVLIGGDGAEVLRGGAGRDRLQGGGGGDGLTGGADADVFVYASLTDSTAAAFDTITDFQTGVDRIDLGVLAPTGIGFSTSGGFTTVTANTAAGALVFRVAGSIAQSDLILTVGDSIVEGSAAAEHVYSAAGASKLYGFGGDDVLDGDAGNNLLDGGSGADLMRGGAGDDVYIVDDEGDRHLELDGQGVDEVRTYTSYSLQAFAENITLLGDFLIDVGGNKSDNVVTGHAGGSFLSGQDGDDIMIGNRGADIMWGGEGRDSFVYLSVADSTNAAMDVISDFQSGIDQIGLTALAPTSVTWTSEQPGGPNTTIHNIVKVLSAAGTLTIHIDGVLALSDFVLSRMEGTLGADVLTGTASPEELYGLAGEDVINGGGGADWMTGGTGNDTYFVDTAGDRAIEAAGEGFDVLAASVSYRLGTRASIELMTTGWIEGTAAIDLSGNELDQQIWGNAAANLISGNDGDDTLFGFGGADTLVGGNGKDVFFGGAGANDTLQGGTGDDTYFLDDGGDAIVEAAGEGHDVAASSVDYVLGTGASIELMTTGWIGGGFTLALTGNELGNEIWGNDGINALSGAAGSDALIGFGGDDRLDGGGGLDLLIGGTGQDGFAFTTALVAAEADLIADFSAADDTILLDDAVFTGLSLGALNANAFVTGAAALDADDRILYDAATGKLYFDADGSGSGAAIQFATLPGNPAITAGDFMVI